MRMTCLQVATVAAFARRRSGGENELTPCLRMRELQWCRRDVTVLSNDPTRLLRGCSSLLLALACVGFMGACNLGTGVSESASESSESAGESSESAGDPDKTGGPAEQIEIEFVNARGETIHAAMRIPASTGPSPAVIVLHGSGGLYEMPEPPEEDRGPMEAQFREWGEALEERGFVAMMPASFYSRGFLDYYKDPNVPPDFDGIARLLARVYDAHGALHAMCEHPRVDCSRLALLGFSNGGSGVLLALHGGLAQVEGMAELSSVDPSPVPLAAIAYYPGCGLEGLVSLSDDTEDSERFYAPIAPLRIEHAEGDALLEHCPTRDLQAAHVAEVAGEEDLLELIVHPGVGHGFDSEPIDALEMTTRDTLRAATLEHLAAQLD